jgi:hypothetical protein
MIKLSAAIVAFLAIYCLVCIKTHHPMPSEPFTGTSDGIELLGGNILRERQKQLNCSVSVMLRLLY